MRSRALCPLFLAALMAPLASAQVESMLTRGLRRLSEEAEVFAREAPKMISEETLRQHALRSTVRFRPRVGADALKPAPQVYQDRVLISEYGFATLEGAPGVIREIRRVVSVDNKKIESVERARQTLTLGLKSDDERAKKKLLQDFEKHGLVGAAIDFGQIILQFRRRNLEKYDFKLVTERGLGPDQCTIIAFKQKEGPGEMTIYKGNSAKREPLTGEIWVRKSDQFPLRISLLTEIKKGDDVTLHSATVDYAQTPFAAPAPVAVKHQEIFNKVIQTENLYEYKPFRKFAADAEIKFTEVPEMPK